MKDEAWKTLFRVDRRDEKVTQTDGWPMLKTMYVIINIHTEEVCGTYRDIRYAVKQARRKYKKLIRLMERKFTS